jgi:hypothetical protein
MRCVTAVFVALVYQSVNQVLCDNNSVNTPGRRISMYLVQTTELAKWQAGQVLSYTYYD